MPLLEKVYVHTNTRFFIPTFDKTKQFLAEILEYGQNLDLAVCAAKFRLVKQLSELLEDNGFSLRRDIDRIVAKKGNNKVTFLQLEPNRIKGLKSVLVVITEGLEEETINAI